jgi:hypothetical protein
MIRVTFDLCTYTVNKKGVKMLTTRYSSYDTLFFNDKRDARIFANGLVAGLAFKYKNAAVRLNIVSTESGTSSTEEITI